MLPKEEKEITFYFHQKEMWIKKKDFLKNKDKPKRKSTASTATPERAKELSEIARQKTLSWEIKNGRPSEYKPEHCDSIIDYFTNFLNEIKNTMYQEEFTQSDNWKTLVSTTKEKRYAQMPSKERRALKTWISIQCMRERQQKHTEFGDAIKKAEALIPLILQEWASNWLYNPNFVQFVLKNNYGRKDKVETEVSWTLTLSSALEQINNNLFDRQKRKSQKGEEE